MKYASVIFSQHAFTRMFERGISPKLIERAISEGSVIASYPDDLPYPSFLILYWAKNKPVHAVIAFDENNICHVITAYWPESDLWNSDFRTRRNQ
jgi:hypothetical protein